MSLRSKPSAIQRPFFVYGTLLPGQPNFHLWQEEIVANPTACYQGGRLYDMGNYPMLVEAADGVVQGRLISLRSAFYRQILRLVDALEGFSEEAPDASAYRRVLKCVELEQGDRVEAWAYLGQAKYVVDAPIIKHGDWEQYMEGKMNQIQKWWQDIDTVSGRHEREQ